MTNFFSLSNAFLSSIDPTTIIFIALLGFLILALLVVPMISNSLRAKKALKNTDNDAQDATQAALSKLDSASAARFVGSNGEFSRWCRDKQPVIKRSTEQQRLVDKYFIVQNIVSSNKMLLGIGVLALVIGAILAVIFVSTGFDTTALIIIGAILIIIGIVMIALYKKSFRWVPPSDMMSHSEYEQIVKDKIKEMNVEKMGLEHLGLDIDQVKEIKPLTFTDYEVSGTSLVAFDSDKNKIHSSTQTVMLVYFTDEQVFVYKLQFDLCCNKKEEWTSEFFYTDICDISTYINKNVLEVGVNKIEYSTLKVDIMATNSNMFISMENDKARYASIQAMRQKIREKKMQ